MHEFHGKDLRKGRYSLTGQIYLVTSVTVARKKYFSDWRLGRLLVGELRSCDASGLTKSLAWVVMPDHFHWLVKLQTVDLGKILQQVKCRSAISINRNRGRSGRIWQKGFHDRALRRDEDLKAAARYVIANPLRAGLVDNIGNYPLWDAIWIESSSQKRGSAREHLVSPAGADSCIR